MFTCEHCGNKQDVAEFFGDYWICDNCKGCNDSIEEIRQDSRYLYIVKLMVNT